MFARVVYLQCRRFLLSPVFWICSVLLTVVLVINSNMAIADREIGSDIVYAYDFAVMNTEAVVLSFLPALPFALSYMDEKKEHSLRLAYIRCDVDSFITAKFISVVLSGLCVSFLGNILYFLVMSSVLPVLCKSANISGAYGIDYLLEIGRPYVYLFATMLCQALSASLFTALTFFFSMFIREKYTVMVLPLLCYHIAFLAESLTDRPFLRQYCIDVPNAITPVGVVGKKLVFVLIVCLLVWVVSVKKAERDVLNG